MKQLGLTILSEIDKAQIDDLDSVLREIGDDIQNQVHIPFGQLTLLHFASWVVFEDGAPGPQLIFESNFDGPAEGFLRQLVERAHPGLEDIYKHCVGFPIGGSADAIYQYLWSRIVYTDTFYESCGGFTLVQVQQEQQLREQIEAFLDTIPGEKDPAAIRRKIQGFVTNEPSLAWAREPAQPYTLLERLRPRDGVILVGLLVGLFWPLPLGWIFGGAWAGLIVWGSWIVVLGIVLLVLLAVLRHKERTDPSISDTPVEDAEPDAAVVEELVSRENRRPQNHLASITTVKPGRFRFVLLKVVLAAIETLGRLQYYKGSLGGIPSIHFARWAVINDGQYLLFLSNFDGSWEHYLGEFIDQAAGGLTAVWSNSVNFPRSRFLVKDGATDEQRFKFYGRMAQLYTQLWYSAYPFLSVVNVQNNAAIRAQLWGELKGAELEPWLRRF
jgi:hypothetical protein